jgi:hypothetical protein
MVYHFSSKLSHLAQSFRPQHHFNSIRNAFPSSTGSASTSNVFGSASNSVGSGASQAAGAGAGGTAGGAGAGWHAGSRAGNWSYQVCRNEILHQDEMHRTDFVVRFPSVAWTIGIASSSYEC